MSSFYGNNTNLESGEASGGNEVVIVGYLDEDHPVDDKKATTTITPLIITSNTTAEEINHALENNDDIILKLTNGVSDQILFSGRVLSHMYDQSVQANYLLVSGTAMGTASKDLKDLFEIMIFDSGEIAGYYVTSYHSIRYIRDAHEYYAPIEFDAYRSNNSIELETSLSDIRKYKNNNSCFVYIVYAEGIDQDGTQHFAYLHELPPESSSDVYATFADSRGLYIFTATTADDDMTGDYYPYTVDQSGHLTITEQIPGYNA